jgi:hypothetical protein
VRSISSQYFSVFRIPIRRGRARQAPGLSPQVSPRRGVLYPEGRIPAWQPSGGRTAVPCHGSRKS